MKNKCLSHFHESIASGHICGMKKPRMFKRYTIWGWTYWSYWKIDHIFFNCFCYVSWKDSIELLLMCIFCICQLKKLSMCYLYIIIKDDRNFIEILLHLVRKLWNARDWLVILVHPTVKSYDVFCSMYDSQFSARALRSHRLISNAFPSWVYTKR